MSSLSSWLRERWPTPPPDLVRALSVADSVSPHYGMLTADGVARLAAARANPGRVRDSAFRLLEADALITYACEAALDTAEPEAALHHVLAAIRS